MMGWSADFLQRCLDFSNVLNASIAASWLILAVLFFRLLLKKAPKWTHVVLWGLVAVRLLLPFSIESALSLIPSKDTIPQEILRYEGNLLQEPAHLDVVANPVYPDTLHLELNQSVGRIQIKEMYMNFVWLGGMIVMLLYIAISYLCLCRRVRTAVLYRDNLFQSEHVHSPFVLGIIHPRIYLPFEMEEHHLEHVIAHEQAHIRRRDHWWKPLGVLLLTIHWFNPLMWLAYILLCRDIELACDEKVVRALDRAHRADYSQALLSYSITRRIIAACPLAFGEVGVKKRVQNVLSYKKPTFWVVIVGIVAIVILVVCFLTNPPEGENAKRKLTLEDVVKLSEKGEELVWEDLEEYEYIETGSGLYIRRYEIDERFSLFVGGWIEGDEKLKPLYFYLMAQNDPGTEIDIRTSDVQTFIDEHKGKVRRIRDLQLSEAQIDLHNDVKYSFQVVMTEGKYYTAEDVAPGGGIYDENYKGICELRVLDPNGKILDRANLGTYNYPGQFQLRISDYNKDGYPDVTLGSYGSSNWNIFELYTIDSQGKIRNICEDSIAVGVKDHSVFLTQTEEGNTDFYTSVWNNATGQMETIRWVWDQEKRLYRKE